MMPSNERYFKVLCLYCVSLKIDLRYHLYLRLTYGDGLLKYKQPNLKFCINSNGVQYEGINYKVCGVLSYFRIPAHASSLVNAASILLPFIRTQTDMSIRYFPFRGVLSH